MSQPSANSLAAPGETRRVLWLSLAQLISWGSVFYLFALLVGDSPADLDRVVTEVLLTRDEERIARRRDDLEQKLRDLEPRALELEALGRASRLSVDAPGFDGGAVTLPRATSRPHDVGTLRLRPRDVLCGQRVRRAVPD